MDCRFHCLTVEQARKVMDKREPVIVMLNGVFIVQLTGEGVDPITVGSSDGQQVRRWRRVENVLTFLQKQQLLSKQSVTVNLR
jgi:hypothetical protein